MLDAVLFGELKIPTLDKVTNSTIAMAIGFVFIRVTSPQRGSGLRIVSEFKSLV